MKKILLSYLDIIKSISFKDFIDIAIVAILLYVAINFLRERRAGKLAAGVGILLLFNLVCSFFNLTAVTFLLEYFFQFGFIVLFIIFQPELRSALEKVGGEPIKGFKSFTDSKNQQKITESVKEICTAAIEMSSEKTGALIVIERSTKLGEYIKSGTVLDAELSDFAIRNIFFKGAPLHDGAVVIRDGRLYAAGCFLPLSQREDILRDLGTRHRAALGISEISDAIVVVVSEETGTISTVIDGDLQRGYDYSSLKNKLGSVLINPDSIIESEAKKTSGRGIFNIFKKK
ncbi:MAG: diadenylate cyclase CdaA [Clostridia bacterium]|nr:diadenylate cyclase CdaA [Clostridia bacterium]